MARWMYVYVVDIRKVWKAFLNKDASIKDVVDDMIRKIHLLPLFEYDDKLKVYEKTLRTVKHPYHFMILYNLISDYGDEVIKEDGTDLFRKCWFRLID